MYNKIRAICNYLKAFTCFLVCICTYESAFANNELSETNSQKLIVIECTAHESGMMIKITDTLNQEDMTSSLEFKISDAKKNFSKSQVYRDNRFALSLFAKENNILYGYYVEKSAMEAHTPPFKGRIIVFVYSDNGVLDKASSKGVDAACNFIF